MRLVMAVSKDGLCARGDGDDMSWTGRFDKKLFQLVTLSGARDLVAGARTYDLMAGNNCVGLKGRTVRRLSRTPDEGGLTRVKSYTLERSVALFPGADLIGGLTAARAALELDYVTCAVIVTVPVELKKGVAFDLWWLMDDSRHWRTHEVDFSNGYSVKILWRTRP